MDCAQKELAGREAGQFPRLRSCRARTAFVAVLLLATACSPGAGRPLPPSTPIVAIKMTEYRFEHPAVVPGGRVILQVSNDGRTGHSMTMVRLPDDFDKPVDALFDGESRVFPTVTQVLERPPGGQATLAVDLVAGRYAMICFIHDADGVGHYKKGMASDFRVADDGVGVPNKKPQP